LLYRRELRRRRRRRRRGGIRGEAAGGAGKPPSAGRRDHMAAAAFAARRQRLALEATEHQPTTETPRYSRQRRFESRSSPHIRYKKAAGETHQAATYCHRPGRRSPLPRQASPDRGRRRPPLVSRRCYMTPGWQAGRQVYGRAVESGSRQVYGGRQQRSLHVRRLSRRCYRQVVSPAHHSISQQQAAARQAEGADPPPRSRQSIWSRGAGSTAI